MKFIIANSLITILLMNTENKMTIENKSWTMDILLANSPNIGKPKVQRDLRWTILPGKKKQMSPTTSIILNS